MVKHRLRDTGLSGVLSPHSFEVTTITDLLEQGVPLEDVQRLAGHAGQRTTRLYTPGRKTSPEHRRADFDLRFMLHRSSQWKTPAAGYA